MVCVQVRRRPTHDGLGAVLGGLLTCYFEPLKCEIHLTVLISNFLNESMAAIDIRRFFQIPKNVSRYIQDSFS